MCSTKICKRCNKEQSIDNFYKVPSMKDGHDNTCKTCRKELPVDKFDTAAEEGVQRT